MSSEPPPDPSSEPAPDPSSEHPASISNELPPAINSEPFGISTEAAQPQGTIASARSGQPDKHPRSRSSAPLLVRLSVEGLLGALLIGFLVFNSVDQWKQANQHLSDQVAAQMAAIANQQSQIQTLQAEVQDLKERWYGSPALYSPPAVSNTDIQFFDVAGTTQQELINSLDTSSICTKFGSTCAPDPAVPNGVAWALEGFKPAISSYQCYSPSTTTIPYREFMVLPRWSPPTDGSVKIPLVEAWNALAQVLYIHEAGHVAITQQDVAALNDQAHGLPSCAALISFWASPSVYDKEAADQAAYHARLHADCRPEIGCLPNGYMGW
jgi:uncharacterized coiled-coil protein SlyX